MTYLASKVIKTGLVEGGHEAASRSGVSYQSVGVWGRERIWAGVRSNLVDTMAALPGDGERAPHCTGAAPLIGRASKLKLNVHRFLHFISKSEMNPAQFTAQDCLYRKEQAKHWHVEVG